MVIGAGYNPPAMPTRVLLGVDIGTSSAKGVALDHGGRVLARADVVYAYAVPRRGWAEADADTAEAIDFLEFYARQAIRYADPQPLTQSPIKEEINELRYIQLGVGIVIPPWNGVFGKYLKALREGESHEEAQKAQV